MITSNNLGVWLNHSIAILIDLNEKQNFSSIKSEFTDQTKVDALDKSENLMHNKRQQMQKAFYEKISEKILKYQHVLLFGPTTAKTELHNFINKDSHFKEIKIDVVATDYLSDIEKIDFVKDYFVRHNNSKE